MLIASDIALFAQTALGSRLHTRRRSSSVGTCPLHACPFRVSCMCAPRTFVRGRSPLVRELSDAVPFRAPATPLTLAHQRHLRVRFEANTNTTSPQLPGPRPRGVSYRVLKCHVRESARADRRDLRLADTSKLTPFTPVSFSRARGDAATHIYQG